MSVSTLLEDSALREVSELFHVFSETECLLEVVVGYPSNFLDCDAEIINCNQRNHYFSKSPPIQDRLITEYDAFVATLKKAGIDVHQPKPVEGVPDQLMPRDIGFVVGEKFVIANMAFVSRQREIEGLSNLFDLSHINFLRPPASVVLEGGDVIVEGQNIFVGVGQRSSVGAIAWMRDTFPTFNTVPVYLKSPDDGENVLHLDCTFMPVGNNVALIYEDGLKKIPDEIVSNYDFIKINREEQQSFSTNVLSLSANKVISRSCSTRVNEAMRSNGIEVIELEFDEAIKTGGSLRCATMPLVRRSIRMGDNSSL